jgi:hypothetical protein
VCWTTLKCCYEDDSGPRCTYFIDKFFNFRKIESVSIDAYFTKVKNVADMMEGANDGLLEDIMVYYTIKNLPKEYEVFCEV